MSAKKKVKARLIANYSDLCALHKEPWVGKPFYIIPADPTSYHRMRAQTARAIYYAPGGLHRRWSTLEDYPEKEAYREEADKSLKSIGIQPSPQPVSSSKRKKS